MEQLASIIQKCIKGDTKSQDELYKQYRSKWYMLSIRYARDQDEAKDIFQEGLIQIFKDLKQYNPEKAKFSTWSCRVLVHAALKYLKKTNWHSTFQDIEKEDYRIGIGNDTYEQINIKELMEMISGLPMGYKLVFNMYAIEGYAHKEIAKELGITIGTSKSQLFKARKMLQQKLEENVEKNNLTNKLEPKGGQREENR